jgi:hypothetical protein
MGTHVFLNAGSIFGGLHHVKVKKSPPRWFSITPFEQDQIKPSIYMGGWAKTVKKKVILVICSLGETVSRHFTLKLNKTHHSN